MGGDFDDKVRGAFLHFAEMTAERCPLYAHLSARIADDPVLLDLARGAAKGQPAVNLLLGAVQFLLLDGRSDPLASFYQSLGGHAPADAAWPSFKAFCARHGAEVCAIVTSRRVQTNEVGRCGVLLPAFAQAAARSGRPLHLIEIGASAGLNLRFDDYLYEYADGRACGGPSTVVIRTDLRPAGALDIPPRPPLVAGRIGIDIAPVDVRDGEAMRWIEALIWPDELDRFTMHRAARTLAAADPPELRSGDGLELFAEVVADVPAAVLPCIFHSHATYQMRAPWREAFAQRIDELGRGRDLAHISIEWLRDQPGPELRLLQWTGGYREASRIGGCHHHGRWLEVDA